MLHLRPKKTLQCPWTCVSQHVLKLTPCPGMCTPAEMTTDEENGMAAAVAVAACVFAFWCLLDWLGVGALLQALILIVTCVTVFLGWVRYENAKIADAMGSAPSLADAKASRTTDAGSEMKKEN